MSTDLSGILNDAGVECAELDAYLAIDYEFSDKQWWEITDDAYPAFLALVRIVAGQARELKKRELTIKRLEGSE